MIFKQKDKVEDIFKKIQNKNLIKRYLNLIIGCSLLAFAFDVFFAPKNIVYGGVAGVSIVINRLFGIDKSLFVLIVSAILLVISYFTLGPEKTKGSMAGSIIYPICIKIFEPVAASIDLNIDDTLRRQFCQKIIKRIIKDFPEYKSMLRNIQQISTKYNI